MNDYTLTRWAADLTASALHDPYDRRLSRAAAAAKPFAGDAAGEERDVADLTVRGERLRRRLLDAGALGLARETNRILTELTLAGE